jgi:hypothetical protein
MIETLTCQIGNHTWKREAKRGRKPRFCSDHAPTPVQASVKVVSAVSNTEILTCAHDGHTWTRPKARGRKPPYCPQHRVSAIADDRPSVPSAKIRPPVVQAVLDGPLTELKRKLVYTVHELENVAEWREQADLNLLIETHRRLVLECERATKDKDHGNQDA